IICIIDTVESMFVVRKGPSITIADIFFLMRKRRHNLIYFVNDSFEMRGVVHDMSNKN
ncbi:MAG: hypothetical protein RLZ54_702, partial [Candidatus Parcubacteria bacterium]